jgi:hypothetical protein
VIAAAADTWEFDLSYPSDPIQSALVAIVNRYTDVKREPLPV